MMIVVEPCGGRASQKTKRKASFDKGTANEALQWLACLPYRE